MFSVLVIHGYVLHLFSAQCLQYINICVKSVIFHLLPLALLQVTSGKKFTKVVTNGLTVSLSHFGCNVLDQLTFKMLQAQRLNVVNLIY